MPDHTAETKPRTAEATLPGRLLVFDLDSRRYALRATQINGLAECGPIRTVPGAPREVLGLVEWRGNLLTVLDLPQLLGHVSPQGPSCLLRLAAPGQGIALFLPSVVRMVAAPADPHPTPDSPSAAVGLDLQLDGEDQRTRLIDPFELVRGDYREHRPA